MKLDLINLTLSFEINGKDYGKAFDVEKTSYRIVARPYYTNTKWTLISYRHQK